MIYLFTYLAGLATLPALAFALMAYAELQWTREVDARRKRNDLLRANGVDLNRAHATNQAIRARIAKARAALAGGKEAT